MQIALHHERNLEGQRIIELPDVKTRGLVQLLKPVDQGIAVDKELACRLGNVQAVVKEHVDGLKRLLVKCIRLLFGKYLLDEHPAETLRQLIDQATNAKLVVHVNPLGTVEDFSYIQRHPGFLV